MSLSLDFAVNGRFLTQTPTGVQRYAHNVLKALDRQLGPLNRIQLLVPPQTVDPGFSAIHMREIGKGLSGHLWEQGALPLFHGGPLLNLCNTAPAFRSQQIVCIHDANVFTAPESYGLPFRLLYRTLQPLLVKGAAQITTVSHASARQIARYLPIRQPDIVVLPNGHEHVYGWKADPAGLAPEIAAAVRSGARPYIVALGSRAPHKNLDLVIKIADALEERGIDVVIAGGDSSIFRTEVLAHRPNVRLAGRVSDDGLAYLLQQALCLVFPSFNEGFGLPIVEAMALGCPVISSGHSSMAEVCGDAALLASPFRPDQWVEQIDALRGSRTMGADLREKGLQQVRQFSWDATAAGYLDLMQQGTGDTARHPVRAPALSRVAVIVATRGRPSVASQTVRHLLETQTAKPELVIVSCVEPGDAGELRQDERVKVVISKPGLAAQRNAALAVLPAGIDIVVFFDDDFVADPGWLAAAQRIFSDESKVVALTGHVVADGIKGPGIVFEDALAALRDEAPSEHVSWQEPFSPYGCNMAYRADAIAEARFDERLVLYGWLEDRDFAASLAQKGGRLIKSSELRGVHMGVKSGRVSGERLGYSQIINPLYMRRKGTMTSREAVGQMMRNVYSNVSRFFWQEPFIDRRGRTKGNLLGMRDALRGRLQPEKAAALGGSRRPPSSPVEGKLS
jgi:glycosyltransferase involved in cell wall biosynthesis/GT2 family glycosyltransferase